MPAYRHVRRVRSSATSLLTVFALLVAALVWFAISIYPFRYGTAESAVLAGLVSVAELFEFVPDDVFEG